MKLYDIPNNLKVMALLLAVNTDLVSFAEIEIYLCVTVSGSSISFAKLDGVYRGCIRGVTGVYSGSASL